MIEDKELKELFLAAKPKFDDSDKFIVQLNRRLDAVEYLKQHEERTIRRYHYAIIAALVLGILCGGGAVALILSSPDVLPVALDSSSESLFATERYSRLITASVLMLITGLGIACTVSNILDIVKMRSQSVLGLQL